MANELHEVSAAYPDVVASIASHLEDTMKTYAHNRMEEDTNCQHFFLQDHRDIGTILTPWCAQKESAAKSFDRIMKPKLEDTQANIFVMKGDDKPGVLNKSKGFRRDVLKEAVNFQKQLLQIKDHAERRKQVLTEAENLQAQLLPNGNSTAELRRSSRRKNTSKHKQPSGKKKNVLQLAKRTVPHEGAKPHGKTIRKRKGRLRKGKHRHLHSEDWPDLDF